MATTSTFAAVAELSGNDVSIGVAEIFPKKNWLLANMPVRPLAAQAGTSTFVHTFHQATSHGTAAFRAVNSDYTALAATHEEKTVTCAIMGAKYGIDRVLVGAARGEEVKYQVDKAVSGINGKWNTAFLYGDAATPGEFDGVEQQVDWSVNLVDGATLDLTTTDVAEARSIISALSDAASLVNGQDGVAFLVNRQTLTAVRRVAAIAGYMTASEDAAGRKVTAIDGVPLIDLGARSGSNNPVIPVTTGKTDLYVARFAADGVYMVTPSHRSQVESRLPKEDSEDAVSYGWVELVSAVAVKNPLAVAKVEGVTVSA